MVSVVLYQLQSLWLESCVVSAAKSVARVLCCIDRQVCGKSVVLYRQARVLCCTDRQVCG